MWPPPMWRVVMRPKLLRPPDLVLPSVSILMGAPFHSVPRSTSTSWRRPGVVGRKVLSAIAASPLQARRHVDGMALFEGHHRALDVALQSANVLEGLHLALEELLDRRLDLGLGRVARHLEDHLVVLGDERRLLGDHRRADDVVRIFLFVFLAHLKRA